ncbi:ATP synthase F(0) complex subunit C1, mitochondrial [Frankliniella fusca]|uniref:ATP synthase F(0) complex subunit C1, mitochondrial n=1 Tax=Frankliniella fusca TaxID=407009 RepID=A0AAE1HUT8_9NEOP|nr:ATP synthase F(0) complex subunit C1, mitochondrial [Frankliniella fusca]
MIPTFRFYSFAVVPLSSPILPHPRKQQTSAAVKSGTKKYLSTLNVSEEGVFCAGPGVGTRKQEVERARMRVVNAQKLNLQRVAEDLLEEGDAIQENVRPQVKSKRPSLPVKRSHEVLSAIDTKLNSLACFTNAEGKVELARKGSGIFVNYGRLSVGRLRYKNKPKSMFLYILKLCLPEEILVMDGVSSSGKRGCRKIPAAIVDNATCK